MCYEAAIFLQSRQECCYDRSIDSTQRHQSYSRHDRWRHYWHFKTWTSSTPNCHRFIWQYTEDTRVMCTLITFLYINTTRKTLYTPRLTTMAIHPRRSYTTRPSHRLHQSLLTRTTKSIADTVTIMLTHSCEFIRTEEWTTAKARRGEEIASTTTCSATVNTSHVLGRTIVSSIIVVNRSRLNQGHSALVGSRQWADIRFSIKPYAYRKYNY